MTLFSVLRKKDIFTFYLNKSFGMREGGRCGGGCVFC